MQRNNQCRKDLVALCAFFLRVCLHTQKHQRAATLEITSAKLMASQRPPVIRLENSLQQDVTETSNLSRSKK